MFQQSNPGNTLNVSLCLGKVGEVVNFSSGVFLSENNLLYFHVDRSQSNKMDPFLNKKVSLSSSNEEKVGDLRRPTLEERNFFLEKKLDEIIFSNVRAGQVLVFIPREAA